MDEYQIIISPKAKKELKHIDKPVQVKIIQAISQLKTKPHPQQSKPLVGDNIAKFRLRVGDYRILYDVLHKNNQIWILKIGHRREIYR